MYIVEFCGLPGTGKSTLCKAVEKNLAGKGAKVKNLQLIPLGYEWIERQINKVEMFFDRDCRWIASLFRKNFSDREDGRYWILRIRQNILIAKKARKSGLEVATFDEGCIQFVTSVFHGVEMKERELEFAREVFRIAYGGYDTIVFDCSLEIGENVRRIRNRNRAGDRFLADTDEEIKKRLMIKRNNIEKCVALVNKGNVQGIDMLSYDEASKKAISEAENFIFQKEG